MLLKLEDAFQNFSENQRDFMNVASYSCFKALAGLAEAAL